ncbi:hypothetical protein VSDG_08889 [Cytospora chrysosperma]|uniref:ER-bound oxygenase mpaB/mpaB'/Rubber oxygenase catalytic domain-containing protein n=1 Tax=Cytospora chrysosperma TaxID=252740 RepID=A0A423VDQ5_CYTCH|nr:hypothetical protein VSDG_08889 [Valsa sordida]
MLSFIVNFVSQPRLIADRLYENVTQLTAFETIAGYGVWPLTVNGWLAWIITTIGVIGLWGIFCSVFRFKHEKAMLQRFGYINRASMAKMTNDDAQKILEDIMSYEFPLLYKVSLQYALFKTYSFSTVSTMLAATKSFSDATSAPKRYEDTTIIFAEFSLNPPTSERCITAIARMNHLHSPYKKAGKISNADMLYTLAVAVMEPIRFFRLYEWRALNDMEICAIGTFWKSIGDAMEIEYKGYLSKEAWTDGIEFVEDITRWAKGYEVEAMNPHPENRKLADALVGMLFFYVPASLRPFALQILTVLMGDRVREAFLYPEPGIFAAFVAFGLLNARRIIMRYFCLPRLGPKKFFSEPDPDTGRIHHFDYLVTPYYNKPTFRARWGPMALFTRLCGGQIPGEAETLPEGFLATDLGPKNKMGKGAGDMETEKARMKKSRPSGCPFAAHFG